MRGVMDLEKLYIKNCNEIKQHELQNGLLKHNSTVQNKVPKFSLEGYAHPYPINIFPHRRGAQAGFHCHEFFEIVYVYQGTAILNIQEKEFHLSTGAICLLNLQAVHALSVPNDDISVVYNVVIMPDKLQDIYLQIVSSENIVAKFFMDSIRHSKNKTQYILFPQNGQMRDAENSMQKLIKEFYMSSEYTEIMMSNNFVLLMVELSRLKQKMLESNESPQRKNFDEIIRYIENHCENIKLSDLSKHFHYSANYIAVLLKQYSGKSFTKLVQDIRLKKMTSLLITTNLTIAEIMYEVGYTNRTWVTAKFHDAFGLYPQDFRNKFKTEL